MFATIFQRSSRIESVIRDRRSRFAKRACGERQERATSATQSRTDANESLAQCTARVRASRRARMAKQVHMQRRAAQAWRDRDARSKGPLCVARNDARPTRSTQGRRREGAWRKRAHTASTRSDAGEITRCLRVCGRYTRGWCDRGVRCAQTSVVILK